jgi:hypothetical protein
MSPHGWQPIETAPTGVDVDLWGPVVGSMHSGRVPNCRWLSDGLAQGWFARAYGRWEFLGDAKWQPTHWMRIPDAPALSA